jgi:prepilin-type N-terminal cleavage/methylation domain-containing protein
MLKQKMYLIQEKMYQAKKGLSLLEVVISIAILGILLAGFIPAMMSVTGNTISVDDRQTGINIAESQMEYVKELPFSAIYTSNNISATYPSFTVDPINVNSHIANRNEDLQSITIIVRKQGKVVARLTGFKMKS